VNVVLLSTSKDRVDAIRAASKRRGFPFTVVGDPEQAAHSIGETAEGIFVVDAESTPHLDELLKGRSPRWPILVLATRFDSSAWVELFKAGASEVIGDPLSAHKVDAAFEGFLRPLATPSKVHTIWRTLADRLRVR
jgi:DNA-binding response OmpR family regulator